MENEVLMTDKDYSHVMLIADRSGSMQGIAAEANAAIKQFMEDQAKEPGRITVDVIVFDDKIDVLAEHTDPSKVSGEVIEPRGLTAMNDAIGFGIKRLGRKLSLMKEDDRPGLVVVVIVTDGMENASKEFGPHQIREMVREQTEKWQWQFVFLAANIDTFGTAQNLGFDPMNSAGYVASASGVANSYSSLSTNMSRGRKMSAAGETADLAFSEEDREEAMGA